MANYPILTPTINALIATKNDPTGAEDASKLDDALRQTRNWICDFLSQSFDPASGKLIPGAFDVSSMTGLIRGSDANGGAQREILQGSVSDVDIRAGAVTNAKLGSKAVKAANIDDATITQTQLAANSVGTSQLVVGSVGTSQLADNGVTSSKFADGSIAGSKLANGAVTATQIATAAVSGDKITPAATGSILVGGNTVNGVAGVLAVKQLSGVIKVDANGVTSYDNVGASALPYIILCERAGQNTPSGPSKASSATGDSIPSGTSPSGTTLRGKLVPWFIQSGNLSSVPYIYLDGSGTIGIGTPGRYLIEADAPATNCNAHKLMLITNLDAANMGSTTTFEGTSEYSVNEINTGRTGATTRSKICVVVDLINCNTGSFCYLSLAHFTQIAAQGTNVGDLGRATNASGLHEIYATCKIIKLA